jgi:hypothetical protein
MRLANLVAASSRLATLFSGWTAGLVFGVPELATIAGDNRSVDIQQHTITHGHYGSLIPWQRRHHARLTGSAKRKRSKTILSGEGEATFYFDVDGVGECKRLVSAS